MSLLPGTMLPQSDPFGKVKDDSGHEIGSVTIDKNWWLLLYNVVQNTLSTGQALTPIDALSLAGTQDDSLDSDAVALRAPIANLRVQAMQPSDVVVTDADLPSIARALLLAQDPLLPDPPAQAQPVAAIVVGASPFTYKAPAAGTVAVTGGTVSNIAISRQGTSVATGVTVGLIQVSRFDSVVVTYSGTPTMTFIPGSTQ